MTERFFRAHSAAQKIYGVESIQAPIVLVARHARPLWEGKNMMEIWKK